MKTLQLAVTLDGISHRKDKSLSLRFLTQELDPQDQLLTLEYLDQYGYLLFRPNQFQESEVPKEDPTRESKKSQSARLRAVIYILFKQLEITDMTFEEYYYQKMEEIIQHFKGKLTN